MRIARFEIELKNLKKQSVRSGQSSKIKRFEIELMNLKQQVKYLLTRKCDDEEKKVSAVDFVVDNFDRGDSITLGRYWDEGLTYLQIKNGMAAQSRGGVATPYEATAASSEHRENANAGPHWLDVEREPEQRPPNQSIPFVTLKTELLPWGGDYPILHSRRLRSDGGYKIKAIIKSLTTFAIPDTQGSAVAAFGMIYNGYDEGEGEPILYDSLSMGMASVASPISIAAPDYSFSATLTAPDYKVWRTERVYLGFTYELLEEMGYIPSWSVTSMAGVDGLSIASPGTGLYRINISTNRGNKTLKSPEIAVSETELTTRKTFEVRDFSPYSVTVTNPHPSNMTQYVQHYHYPEMVVGSTFDYNPNSIYNGRDYTMRGLYPGASTTFVGVEQMSISGDVQTSVTIGPYGGKYTTDIIQPVINELMVHALSDGTVRYYINDNLVGEHVTGLVKPQGLFGLSSVINSLGADGGAMITQIKAWRADVPEPPDAESGFGNYDVETGFDYIDGYHETDDDGNPVYNPTKFDT